MKTIMKKQWNDAEFKAAKRAILRHFKGELITLHGTHFVTSYGQLDNILGLAYVSTGMYAILGICNTSVWLDLERKYKYEMICISEDGRIFAECWDAEENEIYIQIGKI